MRTLIVLRHAEAEAAKAPCPDHGRNLTQNGLEQARLVENSLSKYPRPRAILCSDAQRTVQTSETLAQSGGWDVTVRADAALYLAGGDQIASYVESEADAAWDCVVVCAHNPGVSIFIEILCEQTRHLAPACGAVFQARDSASGWRLDPVYWQLVAWIQPYASPT